MATEASANTCCLCQAAAAVCCCTCTTPATPICSRCTLLHFASAGMHVINPLPPSPLECSNEFCTLCRSSEPETVCCCESSGVLICSRCVAAHNSKNASKVHIMLPVKARPYVSSPGYIDRLRARQAALSSGVDEARGTLAIVKECERDVTFRADQAIKMIREYQKGRIAELNKFRAKLEGAINEAQAEVAGHIFEDTYKPTSPIAKKLWNYQAGHLNLFFYSFSGLYEVNFELGQIEETVASKKPKTKPAKPVPISAAVPAPKHMSSPSVYSQELPALVRILPKNITFFNPISLTQGRVVPLKPTISISHMSSAALLPSGKIFVCGRDAQIGDCAFEIDPQTGTTRSLAAMLTKRFCHAVVVYERCVYVFGGTGSKGLLQECEKYIPELDQWSCLSPMTCARDSFNPCLYSYFVLIFGGRGTNLCEKYDISENTFQDLPVKMPKALPTVALLKDEETIVIIQKGGVYNWSKGLTNIVRVGDCPNKAVWGTMTPILIGKTVVIPQSNQGSILRVDI